MTNKRPTIAVFFGGTSDSHDLSQETGYWVCNYIPRTKYHVVPIKITTDGQWQVPLGGLPQQGPVDRMMSQLFESVRPLSPTQGMERLLRQPVAALMTTVRGSGGDDGALQSLGSALKIPVVGSSSTTCQQTSHKQLCATCVEDIVTSPFSMYFRSSMSDEAISDEVREVLVPPFFVKPANEEGSSGVHEVHSLDELGAAIRLAKHKGDILIQEKSRGTEISLTIIEDERGKLTVLPPTIVIPQKTTFYDHLAKRRAGRVALHTPTSPDNSILREAEIIAREVYEQLGCKGYASLDFVGDNNGVELLEVNTVPTLTAVTPLQQQLKVGGVHPTQLVDSLVRQTLDAG